MLTDRITTWRFGSRRQNPKLLMFQTSGSHTLLQFLTDRARQHRHHDSEMLSPRVEGWDADRNQTVLRLLLGPPSVELVGTPRHCGGIGYPSMEWMFRSSWCGKPVRSFPPRNRCGIHFVGSMGVGGGGGSLITMCRRRGHLASSATTSRLTRGRGEPVQDPESDAGAGVSVADRGSKLARLRVVWEGAAAR